MRAVACMEARCVMKKHSAGIVQLLLSHMCHAACFNLLLDGQWLAGIGGRCHTSKVCYACCVMLCVC
jgi:hypothetical protein